MIISEQIDSSGEKVEVLNTSSITALNLDF